MSEVTNYALRMIDDAVKIGTTLSRSWFRGTAREWKNLTPTIYREPYASNGAMGTRDLEYVAAEYFRESAPALWGHTPARHDHISWLLAIQHHGVPTRLLDWTESVLVALFFAAQAPFDQPGVLWCMLPDSLNEKSGFSVTNADADPVRYLAAEVFETNPERHVPGVEAEHVQLPIAFRPPMHFPRMAAQLSRFTIHPKPKHNRAIEDLLTDPRDLVRYSISADSKHKLRRDLLALGITSGSLYLSLDSLAASILDDLNVIMYAPPEPPKF